MSKFRTIKIQIVIAGAILIFLMAHCSKREPVTGEKKTHSLYYTGCDVVKKAFMEEIANAYFAYKGVRINISGGGATKGIRSASMQTIDIGGGCRHKINQNPEINALGHVVAWDAIVIIVNKKNPLNNIAKKKIHDIFSGKISNWSQLGGQNKDIDVVYRSSQLAGVQYMALKLIFNNLDFKFSSNSQKFPSTGPLEIAVERNPYSIAFTGTSSARKRQVKILKIDGVYPSYENISSGKYPFFRPLYIYTNKDPKKEISEFIDFILSDAGQKVIKNQGTVSISDARTGGLYHKYAQTMKRMKIVDWEKGGSF